MKHLLILGAGTAGTMMANKLVARLPSRGWTVTVVDRDDVHVYQPGLLLVPFGVYAPDSIVKPRASLLHADVRYVQGELDRVDVDTKRVHLADGTRLPWDLLILATGTRLLPEQTPGLTGRRWHDSIYDFYTLEGAAALARRLSTFERGRLVVHVHEMPIKCPVAPLEFAFLADWFLTEHGRRNDVGITFVTPLDGAFTKPVASRVLGGMMAARGIEVVTDVGTERIDEDEGSIVAYDGRRIPFDLLVTVPVHGGAAAIGASGLGDAMDFVPTDRHTLQTKAHPDIFALGDCTDLPVSKAGAVAHFQGDVLVDNVLRHIDGLPLSPAFDGHANCFIETGFGKAMLIDFSETTEPLPGRFPLPGIGPFTLLEESVTNHLGKLAFKWIYWNLLVAGKELPFEQRFTLSGKWS
ncbi:MAG: FAD-dependent oxidoreductase [Alphaproteobacteria bacterium]|nr:FAD-dependent oxidoreductase [Alphaproteobacteria bacterium]